MASQNRQNSCQRRVIPLAKIGVFDSGLGGLSILNEALSQAPGHDYLFVADSANAPYGEKSSDWVAQRSLTISRWLAKEGCDAIIVACNTATAGAIAAIRSELSEIPIIGVEPGIKPAAMVSSRKMVGVLATENTLKSDKFKSLLATLPSDCQFIQQAGIGLVPLIEQGNLDNPEIDKLLEKYIQPMVESGADTLVLGCTHYPFLAHKIQARFGNHLSIVDTSEAIIKQMRRLIQDPSDTTVGSTDFFSTADGNKLLKDAQNLMSIDLSNRTNRVHTVTISE